MCCVLHNTCCGCCFSSLSLQLLTVQHSRMYALSARVFVEVSGYAATEGVSMKCELWHKLMISSCKHAWPSHFYCGRVLYPSPKNMHVLCRE